VAARALRKGGKPVPATIAQEADLAALMHVTVPVALERVVEATGGPVLLMKGPELARRYPEPALRSYSDLDLVALDAGAARDALIAAGARIADDRPSSEHHDRPLLFEDLPVPVEIHHRPKWPAWGRPPSASELFSLAAPGGWDDDRIVTLPPAHHAVLVAAHAWAERPLRRLRDLIDLAILVEGVDEAEPRRVAAGWGVARMWDTTWAAVEAMLGNGRPGWSLRVWARHLVEVRERTVLEYHLQRWLPPFAALDARRAVRVMAASVADDLRRQSDLSRRERLALIGWTLRNASRPRSASADRLRRRQG
jgi:hypothetical protein